MGSVGLAFISDKSEVLNSTGSVETEVYSPTEEGLQGQPLLRLLRVVVRLQASKGQPSVHTSIICVHHTVAAMPCRAVRCTCGPWQAHRTEQTLPPAVSPQPSHTFTLELRLHAGGQQRRRRTRAPLMLALGRGLCKNCGRDWMPAPASNSELATRKRSACLRLTGSSWAPHARRRVPPQAGPSQRQPGRSLLPQTTCAVSITRCSHLRVVVQRAGWDCPRLAQSSR